MSHYEIQVLDSYHSDTYADASGRRLRQSPPLVNASRPPGQWQTYDIVFHRPHFAADGSVRIPPSDRVPQRRAGADNTFITVGRCTGAGHITSRTRQAAARAQDTAIRSATGHLVRELPDH